MINYINYKSVVSDRKVEKVRKKTGCLNNEAKYALQAVGGNVNAANDCIRRRKAATEAYKAAMRAAH